MEKDLVLNPEYFSHSWIMDTLRIPLGQIAVATLPSFYNNTFSSARVFVFLTS